MPLATWPRRQLEHDLAGILERLAPTIANPGVPWATELAGSMKPLLAATLLEDTDIITLLVKTHGHDPNECVDSRSGATAAVAAAFEGKEAALVRLAAVGADVTRPDREGLSLSLSLPLSLSLCLP